MVSVKKTQFTALNDKRFYFFDGIVSLPFGHYLLEEARQEKKDLQKAIHQIIKGKKYDLLKAEAHAVRQYERLRILRSILAQTPMLYRLNSDKHRKNYANISPRSYIPQYILLFGWCLLR